MAKKKGKKRIINRSPKKAAGMVKKRLGTEHPRSQPPKGYGSWALYFVSQSEQPSPYRSWLEYRLFEEGALRGVAYEPKAIPYEYHVSKTRKYTPDGLQGMVIFEVKGRFRTLEEARKYLFFRESNPQYRLVFVFSNRGVKMVGARPRVDGTTRTIEEWAESEGFDFTFESECADWIKEHL